MTDVRSLRVFLTSDLYTEAMPSYGWDEAWKAPGGAFVVQMKILDDGKVRGVVTNGAGFVRDTTEDCTPEWLDEVLP